MTFAPKSISGYILHYVSVFKDSKMCATFKNDYLNYFSLIFNYLSS